MEEFSTDTYCPHCENESRETFAFNFTESDLSGCDSKIMKFYCDECYKTYYATTRVQFEVEIPQTFKKKPKAK